VTRWDALVVIVLLLVVAGLLVHGDMKEGAAQGILAGVAGAGAGIGARAREQKEREEKK